MSGGVWDGELGLFERGEQLAAIDAAIDAARAGSGRGLLLEGPAGIGKTSLLRAAANRARTAGLRVLVASGDELEVGLPWGVAVQLFGGLGGEDGEFSGAAGLARALFEPEDRPVPGPPDPFPLLHGLHWLTGNLAEDAPLLLVIDDGHWADPQSLRFVNYLLGRLDSLSASLLMASRAGEPLEPERGELLAHLRSRPEVRSLPLRPLGEDSIRTIVAARLPDSDEEFRAAVAARVSGNPFFCGELLQEVDAEGIVPDADGALRLTGLQPGGIGRAIAVRLGRLGKDAGRLASAVAVLGGGASLELARELAGLDLDPAVAAADSLLDADVLRLEPVLGFVHPIVGEAVEAELGEAEGRSLHLTAARLLREHGATASEVAVHLMAADGLGGEPWVTPTLRQAAAEAMARGAPGRAATLLDRALGDAAASGDPGVLLEAGRAEAALARPRALGLLRAAVDLAQVPAERTVALAALAECTYLAGDTASAIEFAQAALDSIPPGEGGALEAEILANLAVPARANPELLADFTAVLETPRTGPHGESSPAEFVRLALSAFDLAMRGERADAAVRVNAALPQERLSAEPLPILARVMLGFALANLGRCHEAEEIAERILAQARAAGNQMLAAMGLEARSHARWARGDVVSALADSEVVLEFSDAMVPGRVFRALALLEAGEEAEAAAVLEIPAEAESALAGSWGWIWLPFGRATLAFAAGDWESAAAQARLAGEREAAVEAIGIEYLDWRPLAARALARDGRADDAQSLADEGLRLATRCRSPRSIGIARATLGTVVGDARGTQLLAEAIADLDAAGAELEAARARFELGVLLRQQRRPRDARQPLAEAVDVAQRLGARRIASDAEGELRAAGGRPRRLELTGVGSLTPAQRRVAELAARGLSNPEVAQALFLSVRTVESHLTATYSKLEIESREQLVAALGPR